MSKSLASALVGIGIARGVLQGVDEHVLDFFPQWVDLLDGGPRRGRITIEDILTMRTYPFGSGSVGSPPRLNPFALRRV